MGYVIYGVVWIHVRVFFGPLDERKSKGLNAAYSYKSGDSKLKKYDCYGR